MEQALEDRPVQPQRRVDTEAVQHPSPSVRKKRWFSIITIALPFGLLVFAELMLRLVHYGPDLSLFIEESIGGQTYHLMNPSVKARYFSEIEFSPGASPDGFVVPKRPGTFRVFCLGGSTTVGFPYGYVGAFSTFLRDRLKRLIPDRSIEVMNLGITATNSFSVLDVAHELAGYEPDVICVYDGHNEFYGALGVASHETGTGSRWMTQLYLRLIHFRSFLVLRDIYAFLRQVRQNPATDISDGTMMERLARGHYIRYGSSEYTAALENFKANMSELKSLCSKNNIYLLVASQVSNLRDQPPFVSQDLAQWTPAQSLRFHLAFNQGEAQLLNGYPDSALSIFTRLLAFDSLRADLRFERARCFASLHSWQESRREYEKARDFDMLRFRASSDFNNAIRDLEDGHRTFFVDVEAVFRASSPDSIIGSNLILEHLHPNARGNFLIASEFARSMQAHNILAYRAQWPAGGSDDDLLWSEQPMTEVDTLCAWRRVDILTSRWPFRPDTRDVLSPQPEDTLGFIASQMVEGSITWGEGHAAAALFFERQHQPERAEREYKALINQMPWNVSAYLLLGRLYLTEDRIKEASATLLSSTEIEQTWYANRTLGTLAPDAQSAIPFFERAVQLSATSDERNDADLLLAEAYYRSGDTAAATTELNRILKGAPDNLPARELLTRIAGSRNNGTRTRHP